MIPLHKQPCSNNWVCQNNQQKSHLGMQWALGLGDRSCCSQYTQIQACIANPLVQSYKHSPHSQHTIFQMGIMLQQAVWLMIDVAAYMETQLLLEVSLSWCLDELNVLDVSPVSSRWWNGLHHEPCFASSLCYFAVRCTGLSKAAMPHSLLGYRKYYFFKEVQYKFLQTRSKKLSEEEKSLEGGIKIHLGWCPIVTEILLTRALCSSALGEIYIFMMVLKYNLSVLLNLF